MPESAKAIDSSEDTLRVGVDIGGTFTDIVSVANGTLTVTKTPSTPAAPAEGVLNGLSKLATKTVPTSEIDFFAHGTTVATNAVLERTWADTALITTEGLRDVVEVGRQDRPDIYDLHAKKPEPVVSRDQRYTVPERLTERGETLTKLDESAVRALANELQAAGIESVAVSLLFSFENPAHEERIANILADSKLDVPMSLSSDVLPEIREHERTLTTALNAALKPIMNDYLGQLGSQIADRGYTGKLRIMGSNGGIVTESAARETPVTTLLSGPAAGVQGATHVAELSGSSNIITMDMGGTSCDVSLVPDGEPLISTDVEVGEYPVSIPMVDIHTVGAGGGSIAWIDQGGALRVGPQSAGADPGPICYGLGGTKPTITDAHYVLGRLDPTDFRSDTPPADKGTVRDRIRKQIAEPLDISVREAAQGILDVTQANMERALRVVSVERGYDPREFGLVAFGGAGPLHAATLASNLDIPRVIVPRAAGVLSAVGLLISDVLYDYSTSQVRQWTDVSPDELQAQLRRFDTEGREELTAADIAPQNIVIERSLDLRYVGQSFELTVPIPDEPVTQSTMDIIKTRFHKKHEQRYGYAYDDEPIELVTVRTRARGVVDPPPIEPAIESGAIEDAVTDTREATFDGETHHTRIYDRARIPTNTTFSGPAVVEGSESTTVVPPAQTGQVDTYGNLIIEGADDE